MDMVFPQWNMYWVAIHALLPSPTLLFSGKWGFIGTEMCSCFYVLSVTSFTLQLQRWAVATETRQLPCLRKLGFGPVQKKFAGLGYAAIRDERQMWSKWLNLTDCWMRSKEGGYKEYTEFNSRYEVQNCVQLFYAIRSQGGYCLRGVIILSETGWRGFWDNGNVLVFVVLVVLSARRRTQTLTHAKYTLHHWATPTGPGLSLSLGAVCEY